MAIRRPTVEPEAGRCLAVRHPRATKLIPEELVPIRFVGRLVLNRNPDNFFAETEQVAFLPTNSFKTCNATDTANARAQGARQLRAE